VLLRAGLSTAAGFFGPLTLAASLLTDFSSFHLLHKPVDPPLGVDELHLTGEEGMALAADLNLN